MGVVILILMGVTVIGVTIFIIKESNQYLSQNFLMEFLWIILPIVILVFLGLPSVKLLYQVEDIVTSPSEILKITGYQWYWTYEINIKNLDGSGENNSLLRESYKEGEEERDGIKNFSSTMEIECTPSIPWRLIVTAGDVIHRWTIPSLFLKVDAIPGRLNQINVLFPPWNKTYYGQCSELCGVNHRFMPIVIHTGNNNNNI